MSNLLASFNAGVSGLHSAQASLNTTSHNLANAHTPGYTRQQVIVTDSFYQNSYGPSNNVMQVGTGNVIVQTRQIRNTFLDARYRLEFGRQGFYEANRDAAIEIEDMLGELEGEQFQTSITDLWGALSSLVEDPSDIVYKDELVSVATLFIDRAKELQDELNTYQTSLNTEVMKQVDSINKLVTEIKDLNKLIKRYEASGETANDYRDKRNDCLDELSKYINIEVNEERDGAITIYTEGAFLLDATRQNMLGVEYESATSQLLKPVWENSGDFFLDPTLNYSNAQRTDVGSLKGLLVARGNFAAKYTDVPVKPEKENFDTERDFDIAMSQYNDQLEVYNDYVGASVVMTVQGQLDSLVHGIVTMINDAFCPNKELTLSDGTTIHILDEEKAMIGDDVNESMGTELFSRRGMARYTEMDVVDENGNSLKVKVYNEEDPSDTYSLYTIGQLVMNDTVLKDSSTIPTMYNKKTGGKDGYAKDEILAIANSFYNDIGTLDPNSLTSYNVLDYYKEMVGELGVQGGIWNGIISNQEVTVTSVDNERQNVMGVSTDEELSDLIKFQRCYDASSRYITTVAEMLEYLIERLG